MRLSGIALLVVAGALLLANGASGMAAEPTAHDPQFGNKAIWPDVTGKEAFVTQKWAKARVLTWAHPGQGTKQAGKMQGVKGGTLDPADPANWLDNGKPASAPPDENTDIVLPDADAPYLVASAGASRLAARHITVGRNVQASVSPLRGNLWIKPGGTFLFMGVANRPGAGGLRVIGDKHTFIRNDSQAKARGDLVPGIIAQWLLVEKYRGASVEFLGQVGSLDEMKVNEGLAVIGPNSRFLAGLPSIQIIGPEAELQLQSGASFSKRGNNVGFAADVLVMGTLRAGSPERPLTKDATLGLSFKYDEPGHIGNDARSTPQEVLDNSQFLKAGAGKSYGLFVEARGKLQVHSAEPAKARLVIQWHGFGSPPKDEPDLPQTIRVAMLGEAALDGVMFDHVSKGGIILPDPARRNAWKNVFYGPNCAGRPDELFAKYASGAAAAK